MFLKLQSHIIDIDIIRHIQLLPPILVIDIGGEEDVQVDFQTAEQAQIAFDGITKVLQAQTVGIRQRKGRDDLA